MRFRLCASSRSAYFFMEISFLKKCIAFDVYRKNRDSNFIWHAGFFCKYLENYCFDRAQSCAGRIISCFSYYRIISVNFWTIFCEYLENHCSDRTRSCGVLISFALSAAHANLTQFFFHSFGLVVYKVTKNLRKVQICFLIVVFFRNPQFALKKIAYRMNCVYI